MALPIILAGISGTVTIFAALLTFLGIIFSNKIMQLVGGAIIIYTLAKSHILPGWMTAVLVILFIYMVTRKQK